MILSSLNPPLIIEKFELTVINVPLIKHLRQRNGTISNLKMLVLHLYSSDGIVGESFLYGMGNSGHLAIISYIQNEFMPSIIGRDITSIDNLWNDLWCPRRDKLKGGLLLFSLALIDIAFWDIFAKRKKLPLSKILGSEKNSIPVYFSGGWTAMKENDLYLECSQVIERGIDIYKIKIGSDYDRQRIEFLIREFGNKIRLAVDANQYFNYDTALLNASLFENNNIIWFEDPLYSDSIYKLKKLSSQINVPICIGENYYSIGQFEDVCELNAADLLQVDVIRCGGITNFLNIAEIANEYNKKFTTHLMTELSISLIGVAKNPLPCEFLDFLPQDLFTTPFLIKNGVLALPTTPGTGVYINPEMLNKMKL